MTFPAKHAISQLWCNHAQIEAQQIACGKSTNYTACPAGCAAAKWSASQGLNPVNGYCKLADSNLSAIISDALSGVFVQIVCSCLLLSMSTALTSGGKPAVLPHFRLKSMPDNEHGSTTQNP